MAYRTRGDIRKPRRRCPLPALKAAAETFVGPSDIIRDVAKRFNFPVEDLIGPSMSRRYNNARSMLAGLLRTRGYTYRMIGSRMGNRHHTSIRSILLRFNVMIADDPIMLNVYHSYTDAWGIDRAKCLSAGLLIFKHA